MDDAQPVDGPASEGVLDIESATAQIAAFDDERPEDEEEEVSAGDADEESEAEPTAEDDGTDPDEATDAVDEEDATEADDPPIQPPHSWDKEAKAKFGELPREMQEYLSTRENERDKAVSQKLNEAAEIRKQAEERSSQIEQYAQVFDQIATKAQQRFSDRWAGMDWAKAAQELEPQRYNQLKAQYEQDQATLQQTTQAQQVAEAQSHREFLQREQARLADTAPDLVDPNKGVERRQKLTKFLTDAGVPADNLRWASATELGMAYDAMRYRELMAQPQTTTKPTQKPAGKTVKPTMQAKPKPRKVQERDSAMKRLSQSGSVDDAIAAILASES